MDSETQYGFTWGPAEVTRMATFRETRVLGIRTGRHKVAVYVSPTGRSVRVFKDGKELK